MRLEIEVGAVGDTFQLTPRVAGEAELVLDVGGPGRVVRQLLQWMLEEAEVVGIDAEVDVPLQPGVDPVLMPLFGGVRFDEELHLHLFELAGAEDEVAGGDLVAETLADLADAERRLAPRGGDHIGEVDEDALRGLGPQIMQALLALDRAEVGLEHHVEFARFGPLAALAAIGTDDLGHRHGLRINVNFFFGLLPFRMRFLHVVLAMALVALQTLHQRVVEHLDVPGGHPDLARQDDRAVQSDDVVAPGDHRAPPLPLDVLLEFDPQRPVVPGGTRAPVDLAAGIDQAATLGQIDDGIDDGRHGAAHSYPLKAEPDWWRPCRQRLRVATARLSLCHAPARMRRWLLIEMVSTSAGAPNRSGRAGLRPRCRAPSGPVSAARTRPARRRGSCSAT